MTATVSAPNQTEQVTYEGLYRLWEAGNWSATAIDLSADRVGWAGLSDVQRASARWLYAMFLYGEDSVTDNLSPFIDAAPTEEQKYFLATQQADEARHAVFFHRFFAEVIGTGSSLADTLSATLPELNWGYRRVFARLDRTCDELRTDRSLPMLARALTMYHLVVEATLAQQGQHFIEDHFTGSGAMPGFSEGMRFVSRDEQRHVGFGVKLLSELFEASDECKQASAEILRDVLPEALNVFIPPGWDLRYTREYGFELEDIYAAAIKALKSRFRAAGYPVEEMPPGILPLDPAVSEEESARQILTLVRAGAIAEPGTPQDSSPEIQRQFFALIGRSVEHSALSAPFTIQWRFPDAAAWHLRIAGGTVHAQMGDARRPDVTLESTWQTWTTLAMGMTDPVRAVLSRRLRLRGTPLKQLRLTQVFPRVGSALPPVLARPLARLV